METTKKQHLISKLKYLLISYGFTIASFIVSILPLFIAVMINRDKYFIPATGWRVSIGFIFVLLIFIGVTKGYTKKFNLPIWLVILAITLHFLQPILADLEFNLWMGALGSGLAIPLEMSGRYFHDLHIAYRNANITADANAKNTNSIVSAIKSIGKENNDENIIGR